MSIQIENKIVGKGHPVFIIAEIGVNHEGDYETCAEMVRQSAAAGADAIKLQTVDADENYIKNTPSWQLFRTCALTQEETQKIFDLTRELGMVPFTTSPDPATLKWVDDLGVDVHKISSGMMTNDVIIRKTAELGKVMLISTGLGTTEQIDHAVDLAKKAGCVSKIALFQCTSEYPVELSKINLATMAWMADRYDVPVGFSDHSEGIEAAMVATTLGATMIEKHVTLTPGRKVQIKIEDENGNPDVLEVDFDHHIGLTFDEFKQMVDGVRRAQNMTFDEICDEIPMAKTMLGDKEKSIDATLMRQAAGMSRCLVARRPIKAGEVFTDENVGLKRPFSNNRGLEPFEYEAVIGKIALSDMVIDDPIRAEHVNGLKEEKVA